MTRTTTGRPVPLPRSAAPQTRGSRRRPGFTLVELMVAAAVCLVIMAILANCFQVGIDTMRQMRSTGDMAVQLRAATEALKKDLGAEHFPPEVNKPHDGVHLRDQTMDQAGVTTTTGQGWTAPLGGFVRIRSTEIEIEGDDGFVVSTRMKAKYDATPLLTNGHILHFTSVLDGKKDEAFYYATTSNGTKKTRAAEIAYFLDPTPGPATGANGGLRTFNLIRRQRLVPLTDAEAAGLPLDKAVVSTNAAGTAVNKLADLRDPANRLGQDATAGPTPNVAGNDGLLTPLSGGRRGDDVLLSNVLSFEVKLSWTVPPPPTTEAAPRPFTPSVATDAPFDTIENAYGVGNGVIEFDTRLKSANPDTPPQKVRIRAVQIRLRVWDAKLQNARQATLVQEL